MAFLSKATFFDSIFTGFARPVEGQPGGFQTDKGCLAVPVCGMKCKTYRLADYALFRPQGAVGS
jgi:hypothetical protein